MILSRAKPAHSAPPPPAEKRKAIPELEDLLSARDYTGAITLLEYNRRSRKDENLRSTLEWLGYAAFHLGDYKKSLEVYQELVRDHAASAAPAAADASETPKSSSSVPEAKTSPQVWHLYIACCMFYLGMYKESELEAAQGPESNLQTRLLFHLAHKFNDEDKLMLYHQKLQDNTEDQLSLASIHFFRSHYQEAIDVYKKILLDNRDYLALNVYVALCYYKLDYYDVSQEVLNVYLAANPLSAIGINLKACNHMRLYNGKAAETELKQLADAFCSNSSNSSTAGGSSSSSSSTKNFGSELLSHNMVVFRNGENALQVLPPLLDAIPEARLNLVICYLRNDEIKEAFNLIKDLEPSTPQEYTLKGVVNAAYGQLTNSREHLKIAQQYFQLVGASPSECDTIPGRQCMASCFFLLKQFEDSLIYLNSIKSYFYNDDDFNWNYGIAKASNGEYKDAEEGFLLIQNEKYKSDYVYLSWLARCYIFNKKARLAWELYLKMETSSESFSLLQLIANDCYKTGSFFYSAKAFDVLERLDPNPDYWEGKRGACVGVFRQVVAQQEPKDTLRDITSMLRNTSNPQVDYIIRTIKRWAKDNDFQV